MFAQAPVANLAPAQIAGVWYSGLSQVQVAAVAVLRYLQAEVTIRDLVAIKFVREFGLRVPEHPYMQQLSSSNSGGMVCETPKTCCSSTGAKSCATR